MHERGKSDSPVVPAKPSNKAASAVAEMVEERGLAEENTADKTRPGHRAGPGAPSALARVRHVAQQDKGSTVHGAAAPRHRRSPVGGLLGDSPEGRTGGGRGDVGRPTGRSWRTTSTICISRLHAGRYRVKPSRRVYIPKADGRQRPLGIASLEDKIVQRAVVEVLNAVYEADFLGFSYGFRPGRGPHHALDALAVGIDRKRVNWVLDADVRDFLEALPYCSFR